MYGLALILVAAVLNGLASVLLKLGAGGAVLTGSPLALLWGNRYLLGGLVLFALNVLVYFAALKLLPLSTAYPTMVALSFLVVACASVFIFKESIGIVGAFGFVCIALGVALVTMRGV